MPVRWKPSWTEPGSARDRLRDMVAEEREDVQGPFRPIDPDIQIDPAKLPASFQVKPTAFVAPPWQVAADPQGATQFTANLLAEGQTFTGRLGARIENPVTRAIVSRWQQATLNGSVWQVTLDNPLIEGAYELVWMTDQSPTDVEFFTPLVAVSAVAAAGGDYPLIDLPSITPTIDEVAHLEASRTRRDSDGAFVGTFDDTTYPSGDDVTNVITSAINIVTSVIPDAIDPSYYERAKQAVILTAAILIEESYFQDEQGGANAKVTTYRALLTQTMNALQSTDVGTGIPLS